jgi:glucosamine--fructose-6-phosphate aminotransferase (isomerizing)
MCGIVGYIGPRNAVEVLLDGLKRLEYRGYDSAGLAVLDGRGLEIRRSPGKLRNLEALLRLAPLAGHVGLGHTRWATHGRPSEANAHPHADCSRSLVVVHNGILENHGPLKQRLAEQGHQFRSETDTEVLAHLIETHRRRRLDLVDAVRAALLEVQGAYAVGVLAADAPDSLVAARHGAGAVIVGRGAGEAFLASDIPALLPYTREVLVLEDDELAVIRRESVQLVRLDGRPTERPWAQVTWDAEQAQKGGYPHFMLKEIHEQPRAVVDTFRGRIVPDPVALLGGEARLDRAVLRRVRRLVFVACGTSYHAGLVSRFMVERLASLPAEVDIASEFRYRDLALGPETLVVAISQSGETADTLGAARAARARGAPVLAITNVVGSALAREATGVLYTHAGPEIGVASSKTFTATLTACYLVAVALGRSLDSLTEREARKRLEDLLEIPAVMERALELTRAASELAQELVARQSALYLGRGIHHPVALEGALKLKELAYLHAEGYPAGEMKHGPIALVDEHLPVVALAPRDSSYDRMVANLEEVKARGGFLVAVAHRGDLDVARRADRVIEVPPAPELLAPLVNVIPLQLLAYHLAVLRGCDVDQPRNLAKSVTVE